MCRNIEKLSLTKSPAAVGNAAPGVPRKTDSHACERCSVSTVIARTLASVAIRMKRLPSRGLFRDCNSSSIAALFR